MFRCILHSHLWYNGYFKCFVAYYTVMAFKLSMFFFCMLWYTDHLKCLFAYCQCFCLWYTGHLKCFVAYYTVISDTMAILNVLLHITQSRLSSLQCFFFSLSNILVIWNVFLHITQSYLLMFLYSMIQWSFLMFCLILQSYSFQCVIVFKTHGKKCFYTEI